MPVNEVKVNNNFVFDTPIDAEHITSDVNLYISDPSGYIISEYKEGHLITKNFNSKFAPLTFIDDSSADLNIGDINGNVILQLRDGHIHTKNFDSDNIEIKTYPMDMTDAYKSAANTVI